MIKFTKYELVIVGAGVVGMGVALAARKNRELKKILIVDRHQAMYWCFN